MAYIREEKINNSISAITEEGITDGRDGNMGDIFRMQKEAGKVMESFLKLEKLWKEPYGDDSANMIWCFVRRLRKKLEKTEPEAAKIIQSIRKVGYYLDIGIH